MGPTRLLPGTHLSGLHDHYDEQGNWLGNIGNHHLKRLPLETEVAALGAAGTVLLINCATVHAAAPNRSTRPRPMVISGYLSADSFCYVDMAALFPSKYSWQIVHGEPAAYIHTEELHQKMPPDWQSHEGVRIDNLGKPKPAGEPG